VFGMLFCLMAAFWYLKAMKIKNDWVLRIAVPIVLISLFMTFTRGLWIGLIVALFVMASLISRQLMTKVVLATAILFGTLVTFSESSRERVMGIIKIDQSSSERLMIWQNHWAMFTDHPLLGVGFEQNSRLMQEYNLLLFGKEWRAVHAHNHFLQVLTGVGIFGFLFFLNFSLCMYWLAFKLWFESSPLDTFARAIALGSIGAQTVFHLGGMTEAVFVDRESNHGYLLVIALTIFCYQALRRAEPTKSQ
jgi:O-antigen ligase